MDKKLVLKSSKSTKPLSNITNINDMDSKPKKKEGRVVPSRFMQAAAAKASTSTSTSSLDGSKPSISRKSSLAAKQPSRSSSSTTNQAKPTPGPSQARSKINEFFESLEGKQKHSNHVNTVDNVPEKNTLASETLTPQKKSVVQNVGEDTMMTVEEMDFDSAIILPPPTPRVRRRSGFAAEGNILEGLGGGDIGALREKVFQPRYSDVPRDEPLTEDLLHNSQLKDVQLLETEVSHNKPQSKPSADYESLDQILLKGEVDQLPPSHSQQQHLLHSQSINQLKETPPIAPIIQSNANSDELYMLEARLLQWCLLNAKADYAYNLQKTSAERQLADGWQSLCEQTEQLYRAERCLKLQTDICAMENLLRLQADRLGRINDELQTFKDRYLAFADSLVTTASAMPMVNVFMGNLDRLLKVIQECDSILEDVLDSRGPQSQTVQEFAKYMRTLSLCIQEEMRELQDCNRLLNDISAAETLENSLRIQRIQLGDAA